ncbi:MAG: sugar transferase, partial [Halobacteriovoraceae bacterium]|nr:sugar transferase [Halobacteriovoraceae bacterium]
MDTEKDSFLNKGNQVSNSSEHPPKIKENTPFEYQKLLLGTKSRIRPLVHNLGLLDLAKLRILEKYLLLFFDIVSFLSMFFLAQAIRHSSFYFQPGDILYITCPLIITLMANYIGGLYGAHFKSGGFKIMGMVLVTSFASLLFISFLVYLFGVERFIGNYFGRGILLGTICGFSVCSFVNRFFLNKIFARIRVKRKYLVVANSEEFDFILQESKNHSQKEGFDFLSLKAQEELISKIEKNDYIGIIVGQEAMQNSFLIKKLMILRFNGMRIFNLQDFFEDTWQKVPIIELKDQWFVMGNGFNLLHNPVELKVKRIFDITFSLIFFILAMPLMLMISLLIKMIEGGPVIYSQTRIGERGRKFTLYKFRT